MVAQERIKIQLGKTGKLCWKKMWHCRRWL